MRQLYKQVQRIGIAMSTLTKWTCGGCACKCHQPIDVEGLRRYVRLFEIENDGTAP